MPDRPTEQQIQEWREWHATLTGPRRPMAGRPGRIIAPATVYRLPVPDLGTEHQAKQEQQTPQAEHFPDASPRPLTVRAIRPQAHDRTDDTPRPTDAPGWRLVETQPADSWQTQADPIGAAYLATLDTRAPLVRRILTDLYREDFREYGIAQTIGAMVDALTLAVVEDDDPDARIILEAIADEIGR